MPRIDGFSEKVSDILSAYGDQVGDALGDVIKEVAKMAQKELRNTSPRRLGAYAKSWATQDTGKRYTPGYTVYSRKPGLPHLLEFGHANRGGGRTAPRPHISAVNDSIPDLIEDKLRKML